MPRFQTLLFVLGTRILYRHHLTITTTIIVKTTILRELTLFHSVNCWIQVKISHFIYHRYLTCGLIMRYYYKLMNPIEIIYITIIAMIF